MYATHSVSLYTRISLLDSLVPGLKVVHRQERIPALLIDNVRPAVGDTSIIAGGCGARGASLGL